MTAEADVETEQKQLSILYEVCYLIIHILKPIPNPYLLSPHSSYRVFELSQVSPAAFASLFVGVALSLMLFGSITFIIGFMLIPCIFGIVLLFYVAGFVSKLSELAHPSFCSRAPWNCS